MKKKIIAIILLAGGLFAIFQFCSSYFFSQSKLKEMGVEKIKLFYDLSDDSNEADKIAVHELVAALDFEKSPISNDLVGIEASEVKKSFYQFELIVAVDEKVQNQTERNTYRYTYTRSWFDFKISGLEALDK